MYAGRATRCPLARVVLIHTQLGDAVDRCPLALAIVRIANPVLLASIPGRAGYGYVSACVGTEIAGIGGASIVVVACGMVGKAQFVMTLATASITGVNRTKNSVVTFGTERTFSCARFALINGATIVVVTSGWKVATDARNTDVVVCTCVFILAQKWDSPTTCSGIGLAALYAIAWVIVVAVLVPVAATGCFTRGADAAIRCTGIDGTRVVVFADERLAH